HPAVGKRNGVLYHHDIHTVSGRALSYLSSINSSYQRLLPAANALLKEERMKFPGPLPIRAMFALKLTGRMIVWRIFPLLLVILVNATILRAQQLVDAPAADKQTLQLLLQRIDQLEARVKQLEGAKQQAAPVAPPVGEAEPQADNAVPERMDSS